MPSKPKTLEALSLLAVRRRTSMRLLDADIARAVHSGRSEGLTMETMASELGITRQGLYDLLNRTKGEA